MQLGGKTYYRLRDAQDETGASRHLINFLIRDRQIPILVIGTAKVIDEDGFRLLVDAISEFEAKPEPVAL